jgi:N6-adenosine-specific RNA methylase IME4
MLWRGRTSMDIADWMEVVLDKALSDNVFTPFQCSSRTPYRCCRAELIVALPIMQMPDR